MGVTDSYMVHTYNNLQSKLLKHGLTVAADGTWFVIRNNDDSLFFTCDTFVQFHATAHALLTVLLNPSSLGLQFCDKNVKGE